MSRKNCLDNPAKPPKPYRDALVKRRRADVTEHNEKLTPALISSWTAYKASGRDLGADSAVAMKKQLGVMLEAALDGNHDLGGIACSYCDFAEKERVRSEAAKAQDRVRQGFFAARSFSPRARGLDEARAARCARVFYAVERALPRVASEPIASLDPFFLNVCSLLVVAGAQAAHAERLAPPLLRQQPAAPR